MSSNDRLADLKAGGAFLAWNFRDYPVTCTVMFAQAVCYAMIRLGEAGKLPPDVLQWFAELYSNRLLSTEAIAEGRYYTLATSLLFLSDWLELLSAWVGLWFILAYIEYAFRWYTALPVLLLPCILCNLVFLVVARWAEQEGAGELSAWQMQVLEWSRPERAINQFPWRPAPLWWGIAMFALIRIPTIRVVSGKIPLWLFVPAMVALEFTVIRATHGQYYSRDTLAASAITGAILAVFSWLFSLTLAAFKTKPKPQSEFLSPA